MLRRADALFHAQVLSTAALRLIADRVERTLFFIGKFVESLRLIYEQEATTIDNALYYYNGNQLTYIKDYMGQVIVGYDIPSQSAGNYAYDLLGNLTKDVAGGLIDISWNLTGKVRQVKKDDGTDILHRYGPMGNRSYKRIDLANYSPGETSAKETWYVRDAQGNIMATYTQETKMEDQLNDQGNPIIASVPQGIALEAQPIYGSSRIGQYMAKTEKYHQSLGHKHYELSNHLGNVLSTLSDNKYFSASSGGKATAYSAHVLSQQDYMPFGLTMQGRTYQLAGSEEYRFGFQAQEMDRETGFVNYKYRMHDPATGRFFAVDPLAAKYPHNSPYAFSENRVIDGVELEGLEWAPHGADGKRLDINQEGWESNVTEYRWEGYEASYYDLHGAPWSDKPLPKSGTVPEAKLWINATTVRFYESADGYSKMTWNRTSDVAVDINKFERKIISPLERGSIESVNAIVLHRTMSPSVGSTINGFLSGRNGIHYGTHFITGKGGEIVQTANYDKYTNHAKVQKKAKNFGFGLFKDVLGNRRTIGIEAVGMYVNGSYEEVPRRQQVATAYLVNYLLKKYDLPASRVLSHAEVAYKVDGEVVKMSLDGLIFDKGNTGFNHNYGTLRDATNPYHYNLQQHGKH